MAIKNQETGMYEARIWIGAFNKEIIGVGSSKEEAKADAKAKKDLYLKHPGEPTSREIKSPGNEFYKDSTGNWIAEYKANRKVNTYARSDLLDVIKDSIKN